MLRRLAIACLLVGFVASLSNVALAQSRYLELRYTPTKRAQIAIWIERDDGTFLRTLLLTEAVGLRGIGNRPGALQMNSGFRWPYGRREGVLPVWAHRRAEAPGAAPFPRVIFQARVEGKASQTSQDQSKDGYFCLSFLDDRNDDVDATSCASVFNSDKGRFITEDDVASSYAEPYQAVPGTTTWRTLSLTSLYPMRRDLLGRFGNDRIDVLSFASAAREAMPEIDAVTRATAPADAAQLVGFEVPDAWPEGDYVVFVEANTERDFDAAWTEAMHPTPAEETNAWDSWAATYGYAYRGQPSVVYRVPIHLASVGAEATVGTAIGYGELEGLDGSVRPLDGSIADDPIGAPGSGVDRLRLASGVRVRATNLSCDAEWVVPEIADFTASVHADEAHSHEWATLRFQAVGLEGRNVSGYRVKVSATPITNDLEFVQAEDAKAATDEFQGLDLCPIDASTGVPDCPTPGAAVRVDVGKLAFLTHYYVAIRAVGPCGVTSPIASAEFSTTSIRFTTVAPCFVATAAYGSPMADDVGALRRFRNDRLMQSPSGRAFVDAYYAIGPGFARLVHDHDAWRAIARAILRPFVQAARLAGEAPARPSGFSAAR